MSRNTIPVLISSAGRRAALLRAFANAGGNDVQIVTHGCDLRPDLSAACALADHAHEVPRVDAPDFIDRIEDLVRQHGIRLIVPTIDTELAAYASAADRLAQAGAYVHVSTPETVAVVRDKPRSMALLAAKGIPVPATCSEAELRADPTRLGWPVFAKPSGGSASRGLAVFADPAELPVRFEEPMMFQPRLSGPEYTVNMFIDRTGQLRCVVPHKRLQIRAGEVEKGRTERRQDLHDIAAAIARTLPGARGVLCFQVMDDAATGPQVIEINARFGGGYPLAHHAGAHFSDWLLDELTGRTCRAHNDWRDGVTMLRYDDAVFRG